MNKYQKQINNAKTIMQLSKIADHIGVKLGRIKDINKAKAKLTKALEKEQKQVKKDYAKITKARKESYNKELKSINRMRKKLGNWIDVNEYLKKSLGEFQSLAELNNLMWDYQFKGEYLKLKDLKKVAKEKGFNLDTYIKGFIEKIEKFNFENYSPMLEYYGFKKSEIEEMTKEFNKAGYKRQDYFMKVLGNFAKGKNVYQETGNDLDHKIARSNFTRIFNQSIKGGKTEDGVKIDER